MNEENLRRSLTISRGDPLVFLRRPISAVLLALCLIVILMPVIQFFRRRAAALRQGSGTR